MAKLIMLRGLPASGKSTKAQELMKQYGNFYRLNKDLIRTMLHFGVFTGKNESLTQEVEINTARMLLFTGKNVIIDDTNLGERHLDRWKGVAQETESKFEVIDMETDPTICVDRDLVREKMVGPDVIMNMALQYKLYEPKKGYVLCDLDGTLADCAHRLHHVKKEPKDWKSFFAEMDGDTIKQDVVNYIHTFAQEGYDIVFITARPETYKQATIDWLSKNRIYPFGLTMIMRRAVDKRPDVEVKRDMLHMFFPDRTLIHRVIDDRPSVIRMWKEELGDEKVIDVGEGVEF